MIDEECLDIFISTGKETMENQKGKQFYPLGQNLFATVKTWGGRVKVHVRPYEVKTKGGPLVGKRGGRGIALDLGQFQRLVKMKKHLVAEFVAQEKRRMPSALRAPATTTSLMVENPSSPSSSSSMLPPPETATSLSRNDFSRAQRLLSAKGPRATYLTAADIVKTAMGRVGVRDSNPKPRDSVAEPYIPLYAPSDSYYTPNSQYAV